MPLDKELPLLRKFFNHRKEQNNLMPHDTNKLQNTRFLRFDRNDHKKIPTGLPWLIQKQKRKKYCFKQLAQV